MITVDSLRKSFGKNLILNELSFHIPVGQVTGILGENGAGKTTLFRIICSLVKSDAGSVYLDGININDSPDVHPSVFFGGSSGLYTRLTARENIAYFAELNGITGKELDSKINYFSGLLDMNHYIDRKILQFSHGMKQKTALVRMAVVNSQLMLLDEPTTGMDVPSIESVVAFVNIQKKQSKTILYSSHNINELVRICSRILILHKGVISADIDIDNIDKKKSEVVEAEYLRILKR
ncbi:MAG: ATP-binding cassette domain-containing protein [Spirochaetes bacterium]|nr:ATP-binding cassette domain-containing protein [Spirochaetota bacterium]